MSSEFATLGISKWLVEALQAMKITQPTAIQKACIPQILQGKDCIGGAKTGSGKTIAFGAPMLTKWSEDPSGMFGVVLTPTRELAMQIAEQFTALGSSMNIRVALVVGGESIVDQAINLQRKPHFIVATPGRMAHHIMNSGEDTIGGLKRAKFHETLENKIFRPIINQDWSFYLNNGMFWFEYCHSVWFDPSSSYLEKRRNIVNNIIPLAVKQGPKATKGVVKFCEMYLPEDLKLCYKT